MPVYIIQSVVSPFLQTGKMIDAFLSSENSSLFRTEFLNFVKFIPCIINDLQILTVPKKEQSSAQIRNALRTGKMQRTVTGHDRTGQDRTGQDRTGLNTDHNAKDIAEQEINWQTNNYKEITTTQCIYVFCVDLRTNSHYFPIQN